jgi:hypothetical protein
MVRIYAETTNDDNLFNNTLRSLWSPVKTGFLQVSTMEYLLDDFEGVYPMFRDYPDIPEVMWTCVRLDAMRALRNFYELVEADVEINVRKYMAKNKTLTWNASSAEHTRVNVGCYLSMHVGNWSDQYLSDYQDTMSRLLLDNARVSMTMYVEDFVETAATRIPHVAEDDEWSCDDETESNLSDWEFELTDGECTDDEM